MKRVSASTTGSANGTQRHMSRTGIAAQHAVQAAAAAAAAVPSNTTYGNVSAEVLAEFKFLFAMADADGGVSMSDF